MGNRLCKKKVDANDPTIGVKAKSPGKFDRIINRLNLRPSAWKSDGHLDQKHSNKNNASKGSKENIIDCQPLSKSSDWTDVSLEVPENEDQINHKNMKLALIFDNENGTPTPPPRKHNTKKVFKENLQSVAKTGAQPLQNQKSVEEEMCVKKKINYKCPVCDQDEKGHNRDHHHNHITQDKSDDKAKLLQSAEKKIKESKRKKNLSVVSLPNYNELKLSVADPDQAKTNLNSSSLSLQGPNKKMTGSLSTGKLDSYFNRCRSFGSLIPQQLKKLKTQKAPVDVESDDSFAGLEDWDLGLIEHYNPKEASLPRPRKMAPKSNKEVLSGIESLIVKEEDIPKPKPKQRTSESIEKKTNKKLNQAPKRPEEVCLTPPPSPEDIKKQEATKVRKTPVQEEKVEHSGLMRILQEFSVKDKQNEKTEESSNQSSLTPSLLEFEKTLNVNTTVEDFINTEKMHND